MLDLHSAVTVIVTFAVAFIATFMATPAVGNAMKRRGITGEDVHKVTKVRVPEMGGIAILFGLTVGGIAASVLAPNSRTEILAFTGTVLIAGAIGILDDLRPLGARTKPVLTAIACLPILILGTYDPFPTIPLIGPVRLTVLYPLLIPIAIAVTSNAVNMMDVMNGSMAGTVAVIAAAVTVVFLASGNVHTAPIAGALLAVMLAFYYFNRFPAKIFGGDTGSLAVGAALGALSILGRIETVMIVALIPQIMNAFYGLASVRGLRERREIRQRPIRLLSDGRLEASTEKDAPVTIARLILAAGPLHEKDIVRAMVSLTVASSTLALLTYWIGLVGRL